MAFLKTWLLYNYPFRDKTRSSSPSQASPWRRITLISARGQNKMKIWTWMQSSVPLEMIHMLITINEWSSAPWTDYDFDRWTPYLMQCWIVMMIIRESLRCAEGSLQYYSEWKFTGIILLTLLVKHSTTRSSFWLLPTECFAFALSTFVEEIMLTGNNCMTDLSYLLLLKLEARKSGA